MATVVAGMTVSLDGFVADERGDATPLYSDFAEFRESAHMRSMIERTRAVLMGRRTFEMADDPDWYVGNYEFQVPIFVLTHHPPPPPKQDERLTFTFVGEGIAAAVEQAKAAAGAKAVVVVGGASVVQELLRGGLVDELHVDVMPMLLGHGLRLLENVGPDAVRLEKLDVQELGPRTTLSFRVLR